MANKSEEAVLALKWRPKQYKDVFGQKTVVQALKLMSQHHQVASTSKNNKSNRSLHPAIILTGTRGVGKTTLARIFAKAINCLSPDKEGDPCLNCTQCLDFEQNSSLNYRELDGASHNGVEHIRQLIETSQYLPVGAKKKIYVIDEVHMLSQSAFNALLKTLEEPPEHVIFIFATTDPEKIPDTIQSRCLRFDLRSLSYEQLKKYLLHVCEKENIKLETTLVIDQLVRSAKGSIRDGLTLLQQLLAFNDEKIITEEMLLSSLGRVRTGALSTLLMYMLQGNLNLVKTYYDSIFEENIDALLFAEQLIDHFFHFVQMKLFTKELLTEYLDSKSNVEVTNLLQEIKEEELLWIFEILVKDFEWAAKSFFPEKAMLAVLCKLTLRKKSITLHTNSDQEMPRIISGVSLPNTINTNVSKNISTVNIVTATHYSKDEFWIRVSGTLRDLPSLLNYWERTDGIVAYDAPSAGCLSVSVFYLPEDEIIGSQLSSEKNIQLLIDKISLVTGLEIEKIVILVDAWKPTKEMMSFKSLLHIDLENVEQSKERRQQALLNDERLKKFENLFSVKADKFSLNDELH